MGLRGYLEAFRLVRPVAVPQQEVSGQNPIVQKAVSPARPAEALMDPSLGEFEVNMVEPLVGWKGWNLHEGLLCSPSMHMVWRPGEAAQALCHCREQTHHCGIYAADSIHGAQGYHGAIFGQVWGWGRYIRGDRGWRAQFAYPKCFYLTRYQAQLVDALKSYHVDIFVDEPLRIYSAEEEGYDCGYRPGEA